MTVKYGRMYCFMGRNTAKLTAYSMTKEHGTEHIVLQRNKAFGVIKESDKEPYLKAGWKEI